jgi:hypothetical protein
LKNEADEKVKIEYWRNQKIIIDNCGNCEKFLFCYPGGSYFDLKIVEKACEKKEVLEAMKRINKIYSRYESSSLGLTKEIAKKVGLKL